MLLIYMHMIFFFCQQLNFLSSWILCSRESRLITLPSSMGGPAQDSERGRPWADLPPRQEACPRQSKTQQHPVGPRHGAENWRLRPGAPRGR